MKNTIIVILILVLSIVSFLFVKLNREVTHLNDKTHNYLYSTTEQINQLFLNEQVSIDSYYTEFLKAQNQAEHLDLVTNGSTFYHTIFYINDYIREIGVENIEVGSDEYQRLKEANGLLMDFFETYVVETVDYLVVIDPNYTVHDLLKLKEDMRKLFDD